MAGRKISCVVAMATNRGIGKDGELPWRLRSELKQFARITSTVNVEGKKNAVIMGRKTWESIPQKHRPLPRRLNIILSRTISDPPEGTLVCTDLQSAVDILSKPPYDETIESIFIVGGNSVYEETIASPWIHRVYLTRVYMDVECDVFFPEFNESEFEIIRIPGITTDMQEENGIKYQYFVYEKKC